MRFKPYMLQLYFDPCLGHLLKEGWNMWNITPHWDTAYCSFCELNLSGWGTTSIMHYENSLISSYTIIITFFWHLVNETNCIIVQIHCNFSFWIHAHYTPFWWMHFFLNRNTFILENTGMSNYSSQTRKDSLTAPKQGFSFPTSQVIWVNYFFLIQFPNP